MRNTIFVNKKSFDWLPSVTIISSLIATVLVINYIISVKEAFERQERQIKALMDTNYSVWLMDESCARQLQNSEMIQLKIKK